MAPFFEPVLSEGQFQDVVVISGVGTPQGNVHYEFSDLMAFALFSGPTESADEHLAVIKALMTRTADVLIQFIQAAESLVTEYCVSEGFLREVRNADGEWGVRPNTR